MLMIIKLVIDSFVRLLVLVAYILGESAVDANRDYTNAGDVKPDTSDGTDTKAGKPDGADTKPGTSDGAEGEDNGD